MKLFSPERKVRKSVAVTTAAVAALVLAGCTAKDKPAPCPSSITSQANPAGAKIPIESVTLMERMQKPADGIDRNTHIVWQGAKLAIQRSVYRQHVLNSVVVQYSHDGRDFSQGFVLEDHDKDSILEITTVSGGSDAPELPADLSKQIDAKLEQSLPQSCLATLGVAYN